MTTYAELKPGVNHKDVLALKAQLTVALTKLGLAYYTKAYSKNTVYGTHAQIAVLIFQDAAGLEPDKVVGKNTWAKLASYQANKPAPKPPAAAGSNAMRAKAKAFFDNKLRHEPQVHYAQIRPINLKKLLANTYPVTTDCSGFVTASAKAAGAPCPNGNKYSGAGYTGTLAATCKPKTISQLKVGDMVIYSNRYGATKHVAQVYSGSGSTCTLISHGQERGPLLIGFGAEQRAMASYGNTVVKCYDFIERVR